jgi:hypothetical protein
VNEGSRTIGDDSLLHKAQGGTPRHVDEGDIGGRHVRERRYRSGLTWRVRVKEFLVNGGAFTARRLRVYIHSLYNRVVTDILVRIQLG